MSDQQWSASVITDGPSGIGGWLILPVLGLVATPLRGIFHLASYGEMLQSMDQLTRGQIAFIVVEFIGNAIVLLVMPIVLLVLLFRKSASFPRWFIVWAAVGLAFIILDIAAAQIFFGDALAAAGQALLDADTMRELVRSIVLAAVWIPYMRVSRRVANTFVN